MWIYGAKYYGVERLYKMWIYGAKHYGVERLYKIWIYGAKHYGVERLYITLLNKDNALIFSSFIDLWWINTNYSKIWIKNDLNWLI